MITRKGIDMKRMNTSFRRYLFVLIMVLCINQLSRAKDSIDHRLYKHMLDIPEKFEKSKKRFIKYIRLEANNDAEVVESIFYWMAYNIYYDLEVFDRTTIYSLSDSFYSRKAFCSEYARLFVQLCHMAGIEAEIIIGNAKGANYTGVLDANSRHSWNAVKIAGEWKLVEVTWGSKTRLKEGKLLKREPNPYYLFTNPKDLIKTHFPDEVAWQMLDAPLSETEFLN